MKILFVVKNMRISNGVSSYIMNYYRELSNIDDIYFDFLIVSDVGSPYYEEIKKNGSSIYFLPSLKNPIKMLKYLNNLFKNNKYDILHSNVFNSNAPIAFYAKKYKVPVRILHSHATKNGDSAIKKIRNKPFQVLSMHFSNYFFSCSDLAGKNIFKNKKYYVINNAIDLKKFEFSDKLRKIYRSEKKISNNTLLIGTVGRITEQKNPFFILEIIKLLKESNLDFHFWWFGSGNLDNKIMKKAHKLNIEDKISFFGSVNEIYKYYSAMDLFILPSLYEGLPVVAIEAQTNHLKCLLSDRITKECMLSPFCEFLSIEKAETWKNKILSFNYDTLSRNKIKEFTNLEKYDIKKIKNDLITIYTNILKQNN